MSRTLLYGFAALALTALTLPSEPAQAAALRCATPASFDGLLTPVSFDGAEPAAVVDAGTKFSEASDAAILLAQLQQKLQGLVPAGKTYYLQRGAQGRFQKFAAGTTLPGLDCIEVNCPASFPPGTTCWRCVEQIKAPE